MKRESDAFAERGLERRASDMGIPISAIDALPDAPERLGTFGKLSR